MDIKLKHRIIGAVVIVALVVIFVPMLFTKHHQMNVASLQKQPTAPTVPQVNSTTQSQVDTVAVTDQSLTDVDSSATDQSGATQEQQPDQQTTPASDQTAATNSSVTAVQPDQQNVSEGVAVSDQNGSTGNNNSSLLSPETVSPAPTTQPQNAEPQAINNNAPAATSTPTPTPTEGTPAQPKSTVSTTTKPLTASLKSWHFQKAHLVKKTSTKKVFSHTSAKKRLAVAKAANQAWIVQVGSFSGKDHAQVLISKLRKKGFTAFGYPAKVNNEVITRVYVGPAVTLEKAQALQSKLQTAAKIKGIVVKFNASKLS